MRTTLGMLDIHRSLRKYGWVHPAVLAHELKVNYEDLKTTLLEMEERGLAIRDDNNRWNIPLEDRSWLEQLWAKFFRQ